jgi:hypothetical protein
MMKWQRIMIGDKLYPAHKSYKLIEDGAVTQMP